MVRGEGGKVPGMSSVVLTLKCLALLVRKLSVAQIEMNMGQLAPLTITVPPNPFLMFEWMLIVDAV